MHEQYILRGLKKRETSLASQADFKMNAWKKN